MSVQELRLLHGRYIDLSDRFKAAWTFHQFLQGLGKLFSDAEIGGDLLSFQEVYASLKSVSKNLNASSTDQLRSQLDKVEEDLAEKVQVLIEEDSRVTPTILRQFFDRINRYDDKILVQLLKFLVYNYAAGEWPGERIDKADFLVTQLAHVLDERELDPIERQRSRLRETFQALWNILAEEADAEQVEADCGRVDALCQELEAVESLEELHEKRLVPRYRDLKHDLGRRYFEPQVAERVAVANLSFREGVQRLYGLEERRIHSEFNEVFELEMSTDLDADLEAAIGTFRGQIERFEENLEERNIRLDEVAQLREEGRQLLGRLKEAGTNPDSTVTTATLYLEEEGQPTEAEPSSAPGAALPSADPPPLAPGLAPPSNEPPQAAAGPVLPEPPLAAPGAVSPAAESGDAPVVVPDLPGEAASGPSPPPPPAVSITLPDPPAASPPSPPQTVPASETLPAAEGEEIAFEIEVEPERDPVQELVEELQEPLGELQEPLEELQEAAEEPVQEPVPGPVRSEGALVLSSAYDGLIGEELRQLLNILEMSDWEASPKAVTVTPEAQPLRLLPREVVAFRRLHGSEMCDRDFEQFLLESAAVRIRITRDAEAIVGILGEASGNGQRQLYNRARATNRLADELDCRFAHFINQALQEGDSQEAQTLQFLRMRLLRDYSGLFLLANAER